MQTTETRTIVRIDGDSRSEADDLLIVERRVRLVLDGEDFARTVMTPGHEDLWALGHLRCLGLFRARNDVARLDVTEHEDETVIDACLSGLRGFHPLARSGAEPQGPAIAPNIQAIWPNLRQVIRDGVRWLSEAPLYTSTGAAHVAALIRPNGERLVRMEDIGRHNAADKAIGWAVENETGLAETILLTSGRLPEDMVMKGITAGIPAMASVSAATAQGVALAERHGLVLIGFARGERMNVYTGYMETPRP